MSGGGEYCDECQPPQPNDVEVAADRRTNTKRVERKHRPVRITGRFGGMAPAKLRQMQFSRCEGGRATIDVATIKLLRFEAARTLAGDLLWAGRMS